MSGRLEHLHSDILGLILEASSPHLSYQGYTRDYRPHDANVVYNFLHSSKRLAMVYINTHIRRLESYQKIKQRGLPIKITFEIPRRANYVGHPPGIYWPILQHPFREDECRSIGAWFTIIRGDSIRDISIIKDPTEYKPINLRRGGGDFPNIDYELDEYVKTKDTPRVKIDCII